MAASDPTDDGGENARDGPRDDSRDPTGDGSAGGGSDVPIRPLLDDARESLRVERRRLVDEREAFESFRRRVRGIAAGSETTAPTPHRLRARPTGRRLVAVRDSYRETVMAVPHYETEYNDTYERSLAAEFGPEIATVLTRGTSLHERYRSVLLTKTDEAIRQRGSLLEAVERESTSVSNAADRLLPTLDEIEETSATDLADEPFGTLDAYRARLGVLGERCAEVSTRRQRHRDDGERALALDETLPDVQTYLYQDLPVTYPVLSAVARLLVRISGVRRDIEREMMDGGPAIGE